MPEKQSKEKQFTVSDSELFLSRYAAEQEIKVLHEKLLFSKLMQMHIQKLGIVNEGSI